MSHTIPIVHINSLEEFMAYAKENSGLVWRPLHMGRSVYYLGFYLGQLVAQYVERT